MKIINLGDQVTNDEGLDYGGLDSNAKLIITSMKQGIKNPNRVNVYVNGKYDFSLDVVQVVDYKLKVGYELSEEKRAELKSASEYGKLYQRTLEWVLSRPRSKKEVRDYLQKKIYEKRLDKNYIDGIIEKLVDKKYIDDAGFAKWYVQNRFVKKGVSKKRLEMELMKKGVSKEIIDESIDERDEEEEIKKIIARKRNKYDDEKLISYLCRQGFSYQQVQSLVSENGTD